MPVLTVGTLKSQLRSGLAALRSGLRGAGELYSTVYPSAQAAVAIFEGEWSSKMPAELAGTTGGRAPLFEDDRIQWLIKTIGGVDGKTVLELGPLEAGHSAMLMRAGASRLVGVEANGRAFLRCLMMKELLELERCRFLYGDFREYLRRDSPRSDLCIACGVLYHMVNPVELIELVTRCSDTVYLWSRYYDQALIAKQAALARSFGDSTPSEWQGFRHTLHRYDYQGHLFEKNFCGGTASFAHWLQRDELLSAFRHFGFGDLTIHYDIAHLPEGPVISLVARRSKGRDACQP